ncbi:MAG TPA: M15 family metallopeptidase [Pyrinomonadaceae bacterium]|jgi:hypothetical protein|nr:M15 family metallopeptidase [Pyrinomonadaceae bacterium]
MATPQSELNLAGILEPPPSAPRPARAPRPPVARAQPAVSVNPQLDSFVNDVIAEASRRTGYTYKLGSGVRTPEEQAEKVSQGYSRTYNSRHLSGNARDVNAFDSSGNYIASADHPAYRALGDMYREKATGSPVPVRWGGDFSSFNDPSHFEIASNAAPGASQHSSLNLDGILEPAASSLNLDGLLETPDADGPAVETNARQTVEPQSTLPALPQRQTFDPHLEGGQEARDARAAMERTPGASLEVAVPLPQNLESADAGALVRDAYRSAALARGVSSEFFDKWVSTHAPNGYGLSDAKGKPLTLRSAMKPDAYDEKNHALRVKIDPTHLSQIVDDFHNSQGIVSRAADALADPERSAGENALTVAAPVAHVAASALDKAARVVNALTAAEWSELRGTGMGSESGISINPKASGAILSALEGEEVPEYARNPVGEAARNSTTLASINPRLPTLAGMGGDMVDPLMLTALSGAGELAQSERVGNALRGVGLMDRGLVAERPLGIADATLTGLEERLNNVLEVTRKLRAGEELTPEESALAEEIRARHASADAVPPDPPAAAPASQPDSEALNYARERQQFYKEEAARATDPVARQTAQANADDFAAEVARMEGRELHHSELQPRTDAGQFDGPPRSLPSRVLNTASDIINAPKSIKSSIALHGPFRQGVFQIGAHPTFLQDAIAQQVKAFASESSFRDFAQALTEKSWYKPMTDAGLFLPSASDLEMGGRAPAWLREERFASAAAEKIPGVRASSRAYVGAMDSIRSQAVEHYLTTLYGPEMDLSKADPETLRAIARFVNVSTGRGEVPILDRFDWGQRAVGAANNIFWSPRATVSRFNLASPYRLVMNAANPATRPVAALQAADSMRAALTVGGSLALLSLVPGVKVGLNLYKPGWGMVKVGNTEYDLLDGIPSTVKYAAQVGQALYRHADGKPPVTRHGQEQTVYNLTKDFLRKRLSPSAQVAAEAVTGKDAMGEKTTASQMASDLLTPFTLEEMYKAWVDAGGSSVGDTLQGKEFRTGFKGAAKGLPSAVGVPSSTDKKRGQSETLNLDGILEQ